MRGKMDCFGLTDRGHVRKENEDQFLIADLNKSLLIHQTSLSHEDHTRLFGGSQGKLLLVADGMGGQAEGRRASKLAVEGLAHYVLNTMPWFFRLEANQETDFQEELQAALQESQRRIEAAVSTHPEYRGMGTTLTMAYLLWPRVYIVHAGDSRCYLMRGGRLRQITTDHTVAQRLVDEGAMKPEDAEGSRWSHMLWNCLGGGSHSLSVEVHRATLQLGDTLLLCTDGLSGMASDEQIAAVLRGGGAAAQECRRLVDLANAHGGKDNVTVVVAHFQSAGEAVQAAELEATVPEPPATDEPRAVPATQDEPELAEPMVPA